MAATSMTGLVDSVALSTARDARSTTSITRIGTISSDPVGGVVDVFISGTLVPCQWVSSYFPVIDDRVVILVTRDVWVIQGAIDRPGVATGYVGELIGDYGPNWGPLTDNPNHAYRQGGLAFLRFCAVLTGAAIGATAGTGNITDNLMFTITDERFIPPVDLPNTWTIVFVSALYFGQSYIGSNGNIMLTGIMNGPATIATGTHIQANFIYPVKGRV